jgi:hypothetical protein
LILELTFQPKWYPWWSQLANVLVDLVVALICHRTNWHARIQAWLARWGDTSAAAGIAALMGDLSTEELLARASARFRYVTLDMITEENMTAPLQGNDADKAKTAFYNMSIPALLGSVDAYVSHTDRQSPRFNPA